MAALERPAGALVETRGHGHGPRPARRPHSISQLAAAGPLRLHLLCDPTPAARLRHYLRLTGLPALLPEWAYGHWKSRDVYEHQRDVEDDLEGYRAHGLPLDAIVIDSPWETQYNTWQFNPHQFPDPEGLIARMRADGRPHRRLGHAMDQPRLPDGQRPPDPESERMHSRARVELRRGRARPATTSATATASPTSASGGWGRAR